MLLFGREWWADVGDLLPAATHHAEEDPDIGHLVKAAFPDVRHTGEIPPLAEAAAEGWQLHVEDSEDGTFADILVEGNRDAILERIEDVIHAAQWARCRGYRPDSGERPPTRPRGQINAD